MPNHVHALISFVATGQSINTIIIGNGKRFMAYKITKRLEVKEENSEHFIKQKLNYMPDNPCKG